MEHQLERKRMDDDTPRTSGRSIESLIAETLELIARTLEERGDSPHVRELRAKARTYERVVTSWAAVPPLSSQRDATFDLVIELHTKVAELKRPHPPSSIPVRKPRDGR
jgi:hypothetical protein